ncbi:MAG: hypothetical protein ACOYL3_16040 [Desulfuromonadaceae bacterium]
MSDRYEHLLGRCLAWLNDYEHYAVTLGQTTYYSASKQYVEQSPEWVRHENHHKVQWRREGRIKFACMYIWWNITKGYEHNPYEVECRAVAAEKTV